MDTFLTILKYVAIGIGVIIALPIAVVLLGIAVSILGVVIEFMGLILMFLFAIAASLLNSFLELFFTPKHPKN